MVTNTLMAPGARIVVRDEEWLVRRVDPSSAGGRLLTCDGVSDRTSTVHAVKCFTFTEVHE